MRLGHPKIFSTLAAAALLFLAPTTLPAKSSEPLDLGSLLPARDPETMIGALKGEMQERVRDRWNQLVTEDSQTAFERNRSALYPNPSLQAYVNRLGQSLIPREASANIFVSFKILEDPLPYADSLATGTVYLSSGMISLLENESQLAFLLMHEAGHVLLSHHLHQFIEEEMAQKRANQMRLIGTVTGALVGRVAGGSSKDAVEGGVIGLAAANIGVAIRARRFLKQIQLESDQFATLAKSGRSCLCAPARRASWAMCASTAPR